MNKEREIASVIFEELNFGYKWKELTAIGQEKYIKVARKILSLYPTLAIGEGKLNTLKVRGEMEKEIYGISESDYDIIYMRGYRAGLKKNSPTIDEGYEIDTDGIRKVIHSLPVMDNLMPSQVVQIAFALKENKKEWLTEGGK